MSSLSGFILVLVGFGFLIFIHELGHFLAAKWARIRADGFAIGMGPCLVSYRRGVGFCFGSADARVVRKHGRRPIEIPDAERERLGIGETEYSLRALPIGGYVRMLGQEDGNPEATSSDPRSFGQATIFRRGVVILAGITANLILAIVLFLVAFLVGVRFPAPAVGFVEPGSSAARAEAVPAPGSSDVVGLQPGDRIVSIDGDPVATFIDVRVAAAMSKPDTTLDIVVERGGREILYRARPEKEPGTGLLSLGVLPSRSLTLTDVPQSRDAVTRALARIDPALAAAGIGPGSSIVAVNGTAVKNYAEALKVIGDSPESIALTFELAGDAKPPTRVDLSIDAERTLAVLVAEPIRQDGEGAAVDPDFVPAIDSGIAGFAPLARVDGVVEGSANLGILREGDVFLRVANAYGPRSSDLMRIFRKSPNTALPATILRKNGENGFEEVSVEVKTDAKGRIGVYLAPATELPRLARSVETVFASDGTSRDTPAKSLSIVPLATVVSVDGEAIADFVALRRKLGDLSAKTAEGESRSVRFVVRDPSPEAAPIELVATFSPEELASIRALGASFPIPETLFDPEWTVLTANGDPFKAVAMGFRQTVVMVEQVFLTIDRVSRGSVGVDQLQGPVGILHTGTQVASEGLMFMMFFLALISVNLAVVNILPIPIADGGLFLFLMYEKFRGRPPSIAFQNAAAMAGIALVAGLFLLTFYNDISRIFG